VKTNAQISVVGRSEGRRPPGRCERRLENNIETYPKTKKAEVLGFIQLRI
jgi:hypothetical protein